MLHEEHTPEQKLECYRAVEALPAGQLICKAGLIIGVDEHLYLVHDGKAAPWGRLWRNTRTAPRYKP